MRGAEIILFVLGARFNVLCQSTSCPLTKSQSQNAVIAFAKIADFVLNEPRCVNCHGGVNPHISGIGPDPEDPNQPVSLVKHGGGLVRRDPDEVKKGIVPATCMDCHNHMAPRTSGSPSSPWMTAAPFHNFVDKDAISLCKQFKKATGSAQQFLGHIKDDNGGNNFAQTAFNGDRGLDPDQYLDPKGPNFTPPAPPSISHSAFMQLGQDWITAMGGKFQGDESCGCEIKTGGWSGEIHYLITVDAPEIHDQMRDYSGHGRYEARVAVRNGVGSATRTAHVQSEAQFRQKAFRNGGITIITSSSDKSEGSAHGSYGATIEVAVDEASGRYQILPMWQGKEVVGKIHVVSCGRETCTNRDVPLGADQMRNTAVNGKTDNLTHLRGSKTETSSVSRDGISGQQTVAITWDLSWSENK